MEEGVRLVLFWSIVLCFLLPFFTAARSIQIIQVISMVSLQDVHPNLLS